jgi:ParB family chromosome partitioning protein
VTEPQTGSIQLDRAVDSLIVGTRHRADLGDIDALAASIERDGLLQPLTITIDGVLVCGARRLAAIKRLGWRTVSVWVRGGLSDRLGKLLAEQDDNMLHKPYTQLEAAGLYREIKQVMAEDAARRKAATQFSAENQPGNDGGGKFPPPSSGSTGKAREQAAAMIPGGASYKTLEKVGYIEEIAANLAQPETLRAEAAAALERIEAGDPVHPLYLAIRESAEAAREVREATMHALAEDAVARANAMKKGKKPKPRLKPVVPDDAPPVRYPVRAFVQTWGELTNWWTHYDADILARELTDEQFENFLATVEGTTRFADTLRTAREDTAVRPRLRAL